MDWLDLAAQNFGFYAGVPHAWRAPLLVALVVGAVAAYDAARQLHLARAVGLACATSAMLGHYLQLGPGLTLAIAAGQLVVVGLQRREQASTPQTRQQR